jgi:GTPase SAR1 family protein
MLDHLADRRDIRCLDRMHAPDQREAARSQDWVSCSERAAPVDSADVFEASLRCLRMSAPASPR